MNQYDEKRFLGVDFGDKRTGLAVSDAGGTLAGGYKTLNASSPKATAEQIKQEFAEIQPIGIIVGYPVAADGGAGARCAVVDKFIIELHKLTDLPIYRQQERGTTKEAQEVIHAHGKKVTKKRKKSGTLDQISAAIILQRWLDGPEKSQLENNPIESQ